MTEPSYGYQGEEPVTSTTSIDELVENLQGAYDTPKGNIALEHMFDECYGRDSTFHRDPFVNAYRAGRRSYLLELMALLHLDDTTLIQRALARAMETRQ